MKSKLTLIVAAVSFILTSGKSLETTSGTELSSNNSLVKSDTSTNRVLEPYTYSEDFESQDLGAWASYPLWQDNAYDQNFQVGKINSEDPNFSIVAKVTPYSYVDNYMGAEKLLNMYLVPEAEVKFRYYLKTNKDVQFLKVRFAAGKYGKVDYTIQAPQTNKWVWVTLKFNDFKRENPKITGINKVKIYALAFLAKIPKADPSMPIFLGLDDITFKGAQKKVFEFIEPAVYKLPEFKPYIPKRPYYKGNIFNLKGNWSLNADKVTLEISKYTDRKKVIYNGSLNKIGDKWELKPLKLSFPEGLYLAKLTAYDNQEQLSETEFTIHIAPSLSGEHPRLLFDDEKEKQMIARFKKEKFKGVYENIEKEAKKERNKIPLSSLVYDLNQFPDENWLPSWAAFGEHIYNTGPALRWNALAYTFCGDTTAGDYAKNVLVRLSGWPTWVSPWLIKRGRFSEHRMGTWSHRVALAYDLTYDLMNQEERSKIRKAIMEKIVKGTYRTYVYDDMVTSNTSNWIAHTVGGALMNMAAIYGDNPNTKDMEPYFTGSVMKLYAFLTHVTCHQGGAYGEGLGYNNYTFSNLSFSVPSLYNVYNIDVTAPLVGTYNEYIWGGLIKERKWFGFGDSDDKIGPATNWAFLLSMRKDPRLSWFYNYLKTDNISGDKMFKKHQTHANANLGKEETFKDVLFNTEGIPQDNPFDENPDRVFWDIGTTVFKSGWDTSDFAFVMRSGAFYNHQHLDQGSFYLADKGKIFIEDQPIGHSTYYTDPLYQSRFIQPISHSTILINHNSQSQRVGDPLNFAPGFEDHAFIEQYLDGKDAAFSRGNISKLYWDKVKSLTRNVLYIKPSAILMLDIAVPNGKNVDVTELFHTSHLKDINPGQPISKITKGKYSLNILHLTPNSVEAKAVETPHFLNTLLKEKPLVKEGMLTVTARTNGNPLVMANLFITTLTNKKPNVVTKKGDGYVSGVISGQKFAFTTNPGGTYHVNDMETDALALAWSDEREFIAAATIFKNRNISIKSDYPATFEVAKDSLKYYRTNEGTFMIRTDVKPSRVEVNGEMIKNFKYDNGKKIVTIKASKGRGCIVIHN